MMATPSIMPKKAYVKQSNKKMIKLSLNHVSLAGDPNRIEREDVLKLIDSTNHEHYIILFKGVLGRHDYRALYSLEKDRVEKIHGAALAPQTIEPEMVAHFYRYNSGQKDFVSIESKSFNFSTDAVALKKEFQGKGKTRATFS